MDAILNLSTGEMIVQAIIAMLLITSPPDPVKPAFNKVNESRQERESLINEAERRRNQVIPKAEGEASQTVAEAEGYRAERVNAARGEASRFTAILQEYRQAKEEYGEAFVAMMRDFMAAEPTLWNEDIGED